MACFFGVVSSFPPVPQLPNPPVSTMPWHTPHGILNSRTADVPAGDIELVQV